MQINYHVIAEAVDHYQRKGYKYLEVPWIVSKEADDVTRPFKARPFESFMGRFVASGEQSFIQLMMEEKLPQGKYLCVTPCFRDDKPDETHLTSFMKVELIDTLNVDEMALSHMIGDALSFFNKYLLAIPVDEGNNNHDIVTYKSNIELGSYGIRHYGDYKWVCGTGVAEPRFSIAYNAYINEER